MKARTSPLPEPMTPSASDAVRHARGLLTDPAHWQKGGWHNKHRQSHCIEGALSVVCGEPRSRTPKTLIGGEAMKLITNQMVSDDSPHKGIPAFNDAKATEHADVIGLLDRTVGDVVIMLPHQARVTAH
jgi:hypothetical protein